MNDNGGLKKILEHSLSYDLVANRMSADYYNGVRVIKMPAMKDWANIAIENLQNSVNMKPVLLLVRTVMCSDITDPERLQNPPYGRYGSCVVGNVVFEKKDDSAWWFSPTEWSVVEMRTCNLAATEESVYQFLFKLAHRDLAKKFALQKNEKQRV